MGQTLDGTAHYLLPWSGLTIRLETILTILYKCRCRASQNRKILDEAKERLVKVETLEGDEFEKLVDTRKILQLLNFSARGQSSFGRKFQRMSKLVIIDGNAILSSIPRASSPYQYFGSTNQRGLRIYLNALRIKENLQPSHLLVCFDRPEPTFRKQLYVGYQAQRPKWMSWFPT